MAVRTERTFTLKIDCTACLISVLVAWGATWKTSVFWFSLMANPFSVITGRRMIWYAVFIRRPPPLFHAAHDAAAFPSPSSRLRLRPLCGVASRPRASEKPATSRSRTARKSPGHNAAGDTDAHRCLAPVRGHGYCAPLTPDCGSHGLPPRPPKPSNPLSTRPEPRGIPWSSVLSHRTHSPRSACHRPTSPPAPNAARPELSCVETCNRRSAEPDHAPCRHAATEATGWSRCGRGQFPFASTAFYPNRKLASGPWWRAYRRAARRGSASPPPKAGLRSPRRKSHRRDRAFQPSRRSNCVYLSLP